MRNHERADYPARGSSCQSPVKQLGRVLAVALCLCLLVSSALSAPSRAFTPADDPATVSMLYPFLDCARQVDPPQPTASAGPMGHMVCVAWDEVNRSLDGYDWSPVDEALSAARATTVTLSSGEIISQPLVLQLLPHLHSLPGWEGALFYDATPEWVYDEIDVLYPADPRPLVNDRKVGYRLQGCDTQAVLPMYDEEHWQQRYFRCLAAMGARYEGDPLISAVIVNTGLDGETQPMKDFRCAWNDIMDSTLGPELGWSFDYYILDTLDAYRAAFPNTPLFVDSAPGGSGVRRMTAERAASLDPPIGLKNSAMWTDSDIHQGYGSYVGLFDMVARYSQTLPIWLESAYGFGDAGLDYWLLLAGLHYHPDAMDLHPEYWQVLDPDILGWANDHLGVTVATTPSVWTAFRDQEYTLNDWGSGGASGKVGDWTFWLYRVDGPDGQTVVLQREDLPLSARDAIYARQARRTDQTTGNRYLYLDIDDAYVAAAETRAGRAAADYACEIILLNQSGDGIALSYRGSDGQEVIIARDKGPNLGESAEWITLTLTLDDALMRNDIEGADLRIDALGDGDEIIHRVSLRDVPPGAPNWLYLPIILR